MKDIVPGKTFYLQTFGCRMNDRDSERIDSLLRGLGYERVHDPSLANILLLNTCSIREKAESKVFSALGRLKKMGRGSLELIGVGGCVAQQEGERIFDRAPSVDFVFGPQSIHFLPDMIERGGRRERSCETRWTDERDVRFRDYRKPGPVPSVQGLCDTGINTTSTEVTALVTVMEGCDNSCAYCVVPRTRGPELSRPAEDILNEVRCLVDKGVREVTLLGQNVNSYGKKEGWVSFSELLERISSVQGLLRLRFTTSHPKDLSDDLISTFGALTPLCPHIHLPLQSGSSRILNRMNRGYSRDEYLGKVHSLRSRCPDISITTDIIVGFPGEEEEDFEDTMMVMEEVKFDGHFSFCYSPRPQTRAAAMDPQVPRSVKEVRLRRLQDFQRKIVERKNISFVGKTIDVLVEGPSKKKGLLTGRTPCNRVVNFSGFPDMIGKEVNVTIREAFVNSLRGTLSDGEKSHEEAH